LLTGTLTTSTQSNITQVGTLVALNVTGNVVAGNVYANSGTIQANNFVGNGAGLTNISVGAGSYIENGNSNISISANSNASFNIAGITNVMVVTDTGANINGYANVSGNITAGNISASSLTGTLVTPTQPNITSLGTLTGLTVNGISNLGPNSNVTITGGVANAFLKTNGSGSLSWDTATLVPAQGSNTQVIFNDGGSTYAGNANLTFNKTTGALAVGGNVSAGNVSGGNTVTANYIVGVINTASQPNITEVGSLGYLIVSGNINAGNIIGNGSGLSALTFGNITTFSTAGLTTDDLYLQATTRLNVTASGASGYLFDQYGATLNPTIYVTSGQTLAFNLNITGHPFLIQTSASANYSVGLVHVSTAGTVSTAASAQGQIAGTLYWKVPYGIVGNYKYQCSVHGGMNGNIVVTDGNVANITVGLATYATTANSVSGANVSGQVANASIAGTVYTHAQPNITSVGTLTGLGVNGTITGVNITANTGVFTGNGSGLSSIAGANVTGAVSFATTANAVAGANVSGAVSFATTANAVAGANVSGTVANATFATTAGSATTAGTVTTAAQPNITSVGTLTSLSVTGNITGANVIATNYLIRSIDAGVSAAGSTQGTATILSKEFNRVSTVASGSGVVLPSAVAGMAITIVNTSANTLLVYPASGAQINTLAANVAFAQPTLGTIQFISLTGTQWYTVGGTYA
jgi:hypothetical protein